VDWWRGEGKRIVQPIACAMPSSMSVNCIIMSSLVNLVQVNVIKPVSMFVRPFCTHAVARAEVDAATRFLSYQKFPNKCVWPSYSFLVI